MKVKVPPLKIQGIKTKLVPFILKNITWHGKGKWIEPFLGSGVVVFNVCPERALLADVNPHIISVYQAIQQNEISPENLRYFLNREGQFLSELGDDYYYEVRNRFNEGHSPLDFLFLNRSCFNGMMRFNANGQFNVPFCRKPHRFSQAYITKAHFYHVGATESLRHAIQEALVIAPSHVAEAIDESLLPAGQKQLALLL